MAGELGTGGVMLWIEYDDLIRRRAQGLEPSPRGVGIPDQHDREGDAIAREFDRGAQNALILTLGQDHAQCTSLYGRHARGNDIHTHLPGPPCETGLESRMLL